MIFSRNQITTVSTSEETKVQITTQTDLIQTTQKQNYTGQQQQSNVFISESITIKNVHNSKEISQQNNKIHRFPLNLKVKAAIQQEECPIKIIVCMQNIFFKKKRFIFQILKQFFLFPDDSQSSICSLSTYDPLIFQEEIIHSLVKKMETKIIQNKIWGFLNLKSRPYFKAAAKIQKTATKINERVLKLQKKVSFNLIKKASEDFISCISKDSRCFQINSNLSLQNKESQSFVHQKKQRTQLSSKLISQTILPDIKAIIDKNQSQSSTIYTRQEYQMKYKKNANNEDNGRSKVIKIGESGDKEKQTPSVKIYRSQKNQRTSYLSPQTVSQKSQNEFNIKQSYENQKGFNKYNIIHYHERPRQIPIVSRSSTQSYIQNTCQTCTHICSCCQFAECCSMHCKLSTSYINPTCKPNSNQRQQTFKEKNQIFNQTIISQKNKSFYTTKQTNYSQKAYKTHNNELSQLQSRIQYLNFLRKVVKQQQKQHTK